MERDIFTDYGWIENEAGRVIWRMTAKQSEHAGGILKNRKIDTVLTLSPGKYRVKYITDESHSYAHWIGEDPKVPFYGIVVFRRK